MSPIWIANIIKPVKTSRWALSLVLLGLALGGCSSPPGDVPLSSQTLKTCGNTTTLRVEDMHKLGEPGCDLEGRVLSFPDGTHIAVEAIGVTVDANPNGGNTSYLIINWGTPGVTACAYDETHLELWATSPWARRKGAKAIGQDLTSKH